MVNFRKVGGSASRASWLLISGPPLVLTVAGLILITAGTLKTYQAATETVVEPGPISGSILVVLAQVEIVLGLWLLTGLYPQVARPVAIALFAIFCGVNMAEGFNGRTSCGCFGRLSPSPWIMLVMDACVLAALARWSPAAGCSGAPRSRLVAAATVYLALCSALLGVWAKGRTPDAEQSLIPDGRTVILRPETWQGQRLPILDRVDIRDLGSGTWVVVFYHRDCRACAALIPRIEEAARGATAVRFALIEVFADGPAGPPVPSGNTRCQWGRLDNGNDWFVMTPVGVRLDDGMVSAVARGPEGILSGLTRSR